MALPRNFIIGILIFCIFIVSGMFLIIDFGLNDTQTGDFNRTFYVVNEITSQTDSITNSITNADTDFGAFGVLNSLINSAWASLKILFSSVNLVGAVLSDASVFFGLPTGVFVIITLIISIMAIFISFSIWSAIFQRDL